MGNKAGAMSRIFDLFLSTKALFTHSTFFKKAYRDYRQIFSISEIEETRTLQWALGVLLLTFLTTFTGWIKSDAITRYAYLMNDYVCWPYFPGCGKFYFFEALPHGYSQTVFYIGIFALMLCIVYWISQKQWVAAHAGLSLLWLWKAVVMFVLTYTFTGNFDYYDIILGFILLFLPYKLFFLKATFAFFYFLASTIKIHEGWILSTYFTSLTMGLPIFGNTFAPLVTNFVIFLQIVGSWFLLSKHPYLQRGALVFFLLFHLYSGVIVEYRYLLSALTMLLVLFGPWYEYSPIPKISKKSIAGFLLLLFLLCTQFISKIIPGDAKLTLEGNFYGLFMFEANHQCISHVVIDEYGAVISDSLDTHRNARFRCDPYEVFFKIKQLCNRNPHGAIHVLWQFDHSINGGPFYRIVDEKDACTLSYKTLEHNSWIKSFEDHPVLIGYPPKNGYQ